ncbi:5' nucleotidase, NT5C type [Paremcibacter congregatus]|uniref:5' nucleotidase, NT5C type n=1 Tax=Paremcibacter congregatus TaxID=2043170 RepID=UPI003A907ABE
MKHYFPEITHVFFDMDGVMADWVGGVLDLFGRHQHDFMYQHWEPGQYSIERVLDISTPRLWNTINRHGIDWWAHLEPMPWWQDLLALVESAGVETAILTAPARCDHALTGKGLWINQHLPAYRNRLHMTKDKHLLAAPGRLLIDDHDENCQRFIEAGGAAIVYPQPWNSAHRYAARPLPSIKRQLANYGIVSDIEGSKNGES